MFRFAWLLGLLPLNAMAMVEDEPAPDADGVAGETAAAEAGEETVPVDERIREQLDALELSYALDEDNDFSVVFSYDDGRSQQVWVRSKTYTHRGLEMRDIWSYAYSHRTKYMPHHLERRLLVGNHDLIIGFWARLNNDILYMIKLPANAAAETLKAALLDAAEQADLLEEELHGTDEF